MVREADLIVAMGNKHKDTVGVIAPEAAAYTVLMTDFCDAGGEIPDPIGGSREEYKRIYELIERCIDGMAERLEDYGGWKS
jgi:protein-tyrosine-phosphatase